MRLILTIFFALFIHNLSFGQTKITGYVIDDENKPIENITVILINSENNIIEGDITDSLGYFGLATDSKKVKIQIVYFNEIYYEKEIDLNNDTNLDKIKIKNVKTLQEVSIASEKINLRKELGKFIVDDISTSSFAKGKSTYEVLNFIPILNSTETGVRIFNREEAAIFINGKPVGDNEVVFNMIKSIPASDIEKVEIIANPDSKYAANSKNGIINIVLKKNENEGLKGSIGSSINQSYFNSQNGNGFISYSKNRINTTLGVNLDNNKNFIRNNYLYNNFVTNQQTLIATNSINKNQNYSCFINSDYKWNTKNTIGVQFAYRLSYKNSITETDNIFKNIDSELINSTSINNISKKAPDNNSFRGNINYTHALDSLGSTIYFDNTLVVKENNTKNYFDYLNSNSPAEAFIQNQHEKFTVNATKLDIDKVINDDSKLLLGANFIYSDMKNEFFNGVFDGNSYVSDSLQTNNFSYTDRTISGYINYERIISDRWEAKVGLRLENFVATGKTDSNPNQTNIKNTYIFPSFSLLYLPNEDHEISLDFGSYVSRPYYTQLNPFKRYNSTNAYSLSNSNLLPSLSYELALGYSFRNTYFINTTYIYDKNLFNDFDIVLQNNLIQTTTANYGSSDEINVNFIYVNRFIKNNWIFSASFDYNYNNTKGDYDGIDLNFSNHSYSFRLKNQINLTKKKDLSMSVIYTYLSSNKGVIGNMSAINTLSVGISKNFKNFNISLNASNIGLSQVRLEQSRLDFSFYKNIDYFITSSLSVRYNFGNNKVKKIDEKKSEIDNRL